MSSLLHGDNHISSATSLVLRSTGMNDQKTLKLPMSRYCRKLQPRDRRLYMNRWASRPQLEKFGRF